MQLDKIKEMESSPYRRDKKSKDVNAYEDEGNLDSSGSANTQKRSNSNLSIGQTHKKYLENKKLSSLSFNSNRSAQQRSALPLDDHLAEQSSSLN